MKDLNAQISVVIPLYNKQQYIKRTIDSVLGQTYSDFKIIIVNDGSTDESTTIVRQFNDSRIHLIEQENAGVSAARNRGISESKSELIAFLDADDEWLPDFLETIILLSTNFPDAGAYATGYVIHKDNKNKYRNIAIKGSNDKCGCYFDLFKKDSGVCSSSIAVKRHVFSEVGTFREGFRLTEDLDMWFRIGLKFKFACSPKICAIYHYCQPDNACNIAVPNSVSPLHISFLELKENKHIDPVMKRKAEKYLSYQRAKDIEYICFRGFRDIARHRLNLYQMHCGINLLFVKLYLMNALPSFLLNLLIFVRLKIVHLILTLTKNMMQLCFIMLMIPGE